MYTQNVTPFKNVLIRFIHANFTFWEILIFPIRFELQNFYPRGEIMEFDNKYIIQCLLLKYPLIFYSSLSFGALTLVKRDFTLKTGLLLCFCLKGCPVFSYTKVRIVITKQLFCYTHGTTSNDLKSSKAIDRLSETSSKYISSGLSVP